MKKKNKHSPQIKVTKEVEQLLEDIDAPLLNRFLRDMLIDYLQFNENAFPFDFDVCLCQLSLLFKLIDQL